MVVQVEAQLTSLNPVMEVLIVTTNKNFKYNITFYDNLSNVSSLQ